MKTPGDTPPRTTDRNWRQPRGRGTPKGFRAGLCSRRLSSSADSSQRRLRNRGGWSLIEVIATIVLSAFLVTLLLPLIGSGIQGSRRALLRMPETYSLRTELDAWWQRYRTDYGADLPGLSAAITDAAASAPYDVLYNDWVDFDAAGVEFATPGDTNNKLRITLGNAQGERLTIYFFPIP